MKNNFSILGFFRIFSVGLLASVVGSETFTNFPLYPVLFWQPQGLMQFVSVNDISVTAVRITEGLFWMAAVSAIFGLFTRTSLFVIGVTTSLLFSLKMSMGYMNHRESALIVLFFIFCFYPMGVQWSLDSRLAKKQPPASNEESLGLLTCMRALLCIVYFSAGVSKLMVSGLDWVTTATLQYYLQYCDVTLPMNWAQQLWPHAGFILASNVLLTQVLAGLVLLIELAAPLAFIRPLRYPIIVGLASLQISTLFFLKISFVHLLPLFLAWLPWEKWFHLELNAATK